MLKLNHNQLERVEIIMGAMGQRGNIIARTLADNLLGQGTPLERERAVQLSYAMLFQLSSEFKRITRHTLKPNPRHYPLLETSARALANKGNSIAQGVVKAIERSPKQRDVVMLTAHAWIFQLLVGIEMAMTSTRSPADVAASLDPALKA